MPTTSSSGRVTKGLPVGVTIASFALHREERKWLAGSLGDGFQHVKARRVPAGLVVDEGPADALRLPPELFSDPLRELHLAHSAAAPCRDYPLPDESRAFLRAQHAQEITRETFACQVLRLHQTNFHVKLLRVGAEDGGIEGARNEVLAFKAWLRDCREALGLRQEDVADTMGVTVKTVQNMESPQAGLPRALSLMRYLRVLGVVTEAPVEAPGLSRLESLEATVANLATQDALQTGLQTLQAAIDAQASRGTRRATKTGTG